MRTVHLFWIGALLASACAPTYATPPPASAPAPAPVPLVASGVQESATPTRPAVADVTPSSPAGAADPQATPPSAQAAPPPAEPGPFVERSAVEALDRVAYLFPFETIGRRKRLTLASDSLFAPGSDALEGGAPIRLAALADALKLQGPHPIRVQVYTDALGSAEENRALSERRARTLRDYFVSKGVASERVAAEGKGATRFVGPNTTPEGRAANRRIEVWID